MVKRRGEKRPEMPGGGAAQRLQMFEEARHPAAPGKKPSPRAPANGAATGRTEGGKNAKRKGKDP